MITPFDGPTSAQRVTPRLALDFLSGALDARITFSRALATATRVNASGLIESVAADTARFDHSPITLARLGLLVEEARTNRVEHSQDLSQGYWAKTNTQVPAGLITAPDGTSTARKLEEANTSTVFFLRRDFSVTAGQQTMSFFAKKAERSVVWATLDGGSNVGWFDLNAGTCGITGGVASIQAFPNGWYRCVYTVSTGTTSNMFVFLGTNATDTYAHTGVVGSGAYVWGLQFEAGASFATSYIPTAGATATRNADVATITGTNFSDWFNASAGTLLVEGRAGGGTNAPLISLDDGTTSNRLQVRRNTNNTLGNFRLVSADGSIDVNVASANADGVNAHAVSFAANQQAFAVNTQPATGITPATSLPVVTSMNIGSGAGSPALNGHVKQITYWPQAFTASDLQVLSSTAGYRSMIRSMINPVL